MDTSSPNGPSLVDHLARRALLAYGYNSHFIDTSIGPVHLFSYEGTGTLPPVLFIHGFGAAAIHWTRLMRALRGEVRQILAIDLPGHGFSPRRSELTLDILRDGVIEALDGAHALSLHTEPAIVVGNSLGGAVALRYVAARPERALAAYLMSPGGAPMSPDELSAIQDLFRVRSYREARAFLDRLYAERPGLLGAIIAPAVLRTFKDEALHGLLARVTQDDWLKPEEVRGLVQPVRLLWGQRDKILPQSALSFWRAHLPEHAEIDEPQHLGHSPHFDSLRHTADDLLAFVRRINAPERT